MPIFFDIGVCGTHISIHVICMCLPQIGNGIERHQQHQQQQQPHAFKIDKKKSQQEARKKTHFQIDESRIRHGKRKTHRMFARICDRIDGIIERKKRVSNSLVSYTVYTHARFK